MSLEIRPLNSGIPPPPPIQKMCFITLRSRASLPVAAGGGLLMPTSFAPVSIVSV